MKLSCVCICMTNICLSGFVLSAKFNHYLALAHSALTSFSLMSSQRLSCSICRSRSLMSPIVTHIRRAAHTLWSHTLVTQRGRWNNQWSGQSQQTPFLWYRPGSALVRQALATRMCRIRNCGDRMRCKLAI